MNRVRVKWQLMDRWGRRCCRQSQYPLFSPSSRPTTRPRDHRDLGTPRVWCHRRVVEFSAMKAEMEAGWGPRGRPHARARPRNERAKRPRLSANMREARRRLRHGARTRRGRHSKCDGCTSDSATSRGHSQAIVDDRPAKSAKAGSSQRHRHGRARDLVRRGQRRPLALCQPYRRSRTRSVATGMRGMCATALLRRNDGSSFPVGCRIGGGDGLLLFTGFPV